MLSQHLETQPLSKLVEVVHDEPSELMELTRCIRRLNTSHDGGEAQDVKGDEDLRQHVVECEVVDL